MKKEFAMSDAKFVQAKDELAYQEVLDEIPAAKQVTVVTYNISERQSNLLNALIAASEHAQVTLITNIPSRWEQYYGDCFRESARRKINVYLSNLSPESNGKMFSTYFDFSNHGKIVMTDSVVYVGSANFSEESARNNEFGVISRDAEFIAFLSENIIPAIIDDSEPFCSYNYMPVYAEAEMALSAFFHYTEEFHYQAYLNHDDIDGNWDIYNIFNDEMSVETCNAFLHVLTHLMELQNTIVEALYDTLGEDVELPDVLSVLLGELKQLNKSIQEELESDEIHELANFFSNQYINQALQEDYAMEAYEENLENCIEKAGEDAAVQLIELANDAEDSVEYITVNAPVYLKKYKELLDYFGQYKLTKINPSIDNT